MDDTGMVDVQDLSDAAQGGAFEVEPHGQRAGGWIIPRGLAGGGEVVLTGRAAVALRAAAVEAGLHHSAGRPAMRARGGSIHAPILLLLCLFHHSPRWMGKWRNFAIATAPLLVGQQ